MAEAPYAAAAGCLVVRCLEASIAVCACVTWSPSCPTISRRRHCRALSRYKREFPQGHISALTLSPAHPASHTTPPSTTC